MKFLFPGDPVLWLQEITIFWRRNSCNRFPGEQMPGKSRDFLDTSSGDEEIRKAPCHTCSYMKRLVYILMIF